MPRAQLPRRGLVPFFIDWGDTVHPCEALPDRGIRLARLRAHHPDTDAVRADLAALGTELEVVAGGSGAGSRAGDPGRDHRHAVA